MSKPRLIGFSGRARAGKSTAAKFLQASHGYTKMSFADPIRLMLSIIIPDFHSIPDSLKETPMDELCGKSPRQAMQLLGTEWGRDLIGDQLWARASMRRASAVIEGGGFAVFDDVRFQNEVDGILSLGGIIVEIIRPQILEKVAAHSSEQQVLSGVSRRITNNTQEDFLAEVQSLLEGPCAGDEK